MLQFKMYYLKPILFIAQKAEKESFLDGDSRENDKAMALAKSLLVKIAIQMKRKIKGLNIIQQFPEEALALDQMQFRAQKVLNLNHKFPPFQHYSQLYLKNYLYFICILSFSGTSSQGGAIGGAFGPARLLGVPKPRSGLGNGKFSFM